MKRMKEASLLSFIACALVATASADRMRQVLLSDRMPEFDLVVAGVLVRLEVIGTVDATTGKAFVPVAHIRVEEAFRGAGVKVGEQIGVALERSLPTEAMAKLMTEAMKGRRAVWFCRRNPAGSLVRFRRVYNTSPSEPKLWEPFLKPFRDRAAELARQAPLELSLALDPGIIVQELPAQATVSLRVAGQEPAKLPGGLTWRGALAVEVDLSLLAGAGPVAIQKVGAPRPAIAVLNVRATPKSGLPARVDPGMMVGARALIRVNGFDASKGPTPVTCFAKLLSPRGATIACSPPVRFLVVAPPTHAHDRRALLAVSQANLWPFMGPHDLAPTEGQIEQLRTLSAEHRTALLGPAIECGLVFAGDRAFPRDERITRLRELSRLEHFGFAADCLVRLAAELRSAGRRDEAQAVLDQLAKRRLH